MRLRPTGSPHFGQYRWDSGTAGSDCTAVAGSRNGTGGTTTRFAPSRPRPAVRLRLERPVPVETPASPAPVGAPPPIVAAEVGTLRAEVPEAPVADAGAALAGALWPHSSQYPSGA
ncbi:hypothetical protein Raf01_01200 [Rugosimonospora africana]|uniref:Uncharacterized protein n=1 Tax=Rugosimonospora africana TaxID=556532 RepID=A0A8J3QM25_9ACTN|nr:hypothetical protein Raf01_01200 [Rugosimonospora africana]